jgi:hypothetical protein
VLFMIGRELVRQFGPRTAGKEVAGFLFKGVMFFVGCWYMVLSGYIAKKLTNSSWAMVPLMVFLWMLPTAIFLIVYAKVIIPRRKRLEGKKQEAK